MTRRPVPLRASFLAALVTVLSTAAVASAQGAPALQPVSHGNLGRAPVSIHDSVVGPRSGAHRTLSSVGAFISRAPYVRAADGELVRVSASPGLQSTPASLKSYATLFASFVHSSELRSLSVYLAPLSEMRDVCGGEADSCFSPSDDEIVLVGETPPDGTPIEEIAAHEYGHHIVLRRSNRPWDAGDWGPKYWATYEGICPRVRLRTAFPGDEDSHYELNPGEAWAETNRVLNGGSDPWVRVDRSFAPDLTDLRLARRDILHPFRRNTDSYRRGALRAGAGPVRLHLRAPLDGTDAISVHTSGSLDADLYLYAGGHLIGRSTRHGHGELLRATGCGLGSLTVEVRRRSGAGSFVLHTSLPY